MAVVTNNRMIHCLGVAAVQSINCRVAEVFKQYDEEFVWLQEILAECKRTFAKSDVQLLPKTPSAKRVKRRARRTQETDDEVFDKPVKKSSISERSTDIETATEENYSTPPKRPYRTRAASRTVTAESGRPKGSSKTRNTRANKANPPVPSPVFSIQTEVSKASPVSNKVLSPQSPSVKENVTPINNRVKDVSKVENSLICKNTPVEGSPTPKNKILSPYSKSNGHGHVKDKVHAFEELIESNSPTPQSGKTQARELKNERIPETPEQMENSPNTPHTAIRKDVLSPRSVEKNCVVVSDSPNKNVNKETPKNSRRSSRRSVRKSLKMLVSDTRLDTAVRVMPVIISQTARLLSPQKNKDKENVQPEKTSTNMMTESVSESSMSSKKSTRTRLRLKKKGDTSTAENSSQNEENSSVADNMDTDTEFKSSNEKQETKRSKSSGLSSELEKKMESNEENRKVSLEKPVVSSTRTKARKAQPASASSDADDCKENKSNQDDNNKCVGRSTRTKARKAQQQDSVTSESENTVSSDQNDDEVMKPVKTSTRTKTRKMQPPSCSSDSEVESAKPVRASTRTKQRTNTTSASTVSSTSAPSDTTESEEDSGIHCSKLSSESQPRFTRSKMRPPKAQPVISVTSEESEVEDAPPTRSTRTKSRKRQLDEDDEADVSLSKRSCTEETRSLNTTYETSGHHGETISDQEMEIELPDYGTCPSAKIVRPMSFLNNLSNKIAVKPASCGPKLIKSFIQRNTPPPSLSMKQKQEQKKKELQEKQRKEQERLQKRDELLKMRIEETRKKREERMKKVAELREQKNKQDQEQKNRIAKKMEEKRQLTENLKEERLKEEKEKQKMRMKKQMEIEEKKKQEEEERLRKIREKEEEDRQFQESLQRKKEQEEQERQKRIADELKKQRDHLERMAVLEQERQAERERLKQLDEEKEKERQRQKDEREKLLAKEKAEREKLEIEKKKERDLQIKRGMEKIKELEKARIQEEQKRREEIKQREMAIKQIISKHNTALAHTVNEITSHPNLPKPNLNTTQTMPSSDSHYNSDSYEMTPAKKIKKPSTSDNYDISDIKSDDSTDDDEAPKKRIPPWASGAILKSSLINQHYHPPNLDQIFEEIVPPDLNELFVKKKARFNKRTSSAHWDSPILKPGTMLHC